MLNQALVSLEVICQTNGFTEPDFKCLRSLSTSAAGCLTLCLTCKYQIVAMVLCTQIECV